MISVGVATMTVFCFFKRKFKKYFLKNILKFHDFSFKPNTSLSEAERVVQLARCSPPVEEGRECAEGGRDTLQKHVDIFP